MAIILRRTKGSTLTHDELDDNFQQLSISNLDSAKVEALIDSAYIQQRVPESYLETIIDSDYVENRVTHRDSSFVTGIVDSAYILARAPSQDFLDSSEVINLVDSAYVQARVTLRDSSFVTGIVDSGYVTGLIDSHVTNLIDSNYVANRTPSGDLITGSGIGGGVNTTPLTHPVGSYMIAKVLKSVNDTYNLGATYPGIFPGDTIAGSNLYYQRGIGGTGGYPAGIYNAVSIGSGTWKALAFAGGTIEGQIRIGGVNYDAALAVLYQRVA